MKSNLPSVLNEPTSQRPAAAAPAGQFTAARIAAVLGRDVRSVREALAGREPDGTAVVSSNPAKTYLASSLPEGFRLSLENLAKARGFDSVERLLSRDNSRWEPALAVADLHPEEIARAKKRAAALARWVQFYSEGSRPVGEIHAEAAAVHRQGVGYEISAGAVDAIIRRTINRDRGRAEFHRWELYLPDNPKRLTSAPGAAPEAAFQQVESYLETVNASVPSLKDRSWVWTAMCDNLQELIEAGEQLRRARRRLVTYVFQRAPWLCSSRESLAKCFDDKWGRYCAGERFVADRRPTLSGTFRDLPLTPDDEKELIARGLNGGIAKAWRDALKEGALSPGVIQSFISNPSSKSYVPQRVRALVAPKVNMLEDIHHGPRQHELNGAHITRDWSGVHPGDWYQSDDCTLPIYYWEAGPDGAPRALRGQFLPMIDCKTTRILSFALHSEKNYNAKVIRGLILRTHDTYGLPRDGYYFENGIWEKSKLLKGAREAAGDEVPLEETERGLRDFVKFRHARLPRGKVIEGVLGILQRDMEDQPGYVGRNEQTERFERVQKNLQFAASGHLDYAKFLLHRDEWVERLEQVCDKFNGERQDGHLKGLSPREVWERDFDFEKPLVQLNHYTRRLLANHRRPLRVGKNGLCIEISGERHWFRSEATGRIIGETVQTYFNPEDLSSIWLERSGGQILVVPLAPVVPAMDATRDQLADARASCLAHNRPAATLYRSIASHFPDNGPSPFRQTVVTDEFAMDSLVISDQQYKIKAQQGQAVQQQKKLGRYQRKFGNLTGSSAVAPARLLLAGELLEDANQDENAPSRS